MLEKRFDLLDDTTPVVFTDGTKVYEDLAKTYKTHKVGYFILAPSGAGKTHFVNAQKQSDWIDGDVLWMTAKAHPEGEWWLKPLDEIMEIERRSDIITTQAKKLGFWIIGTDCYSIVPDAIVIPHWSTHKKYIRMRESGDYDGGATSAQFEGLLRARKWMAGFARKGVPKFNSVSEAASYLAKKQP
jgi:hypothetical protein